MHNIAFSPLVNRLSSASNNAVRRSINEALGLFPCSESLLWAHPILRQKHIRCRSLSERPSAVGAWHCIMQEFAPCIMLKDVTFYHLSPLQFPIQRSASFWMSLLVPVDCCENRATKWQVVSLSLGTWYQTVNTAISIYTVIVYHIYTLRTHLNR